MSTVIEDVLRRIVREELRAELEKVVAQLQGTARLELGDAQPRYLSVRDAAGIAGVGEGTIRGWVSAGELVAYRAGRRIRIRLDDLELYLARDREPADWDEEERLREILREVG